jgi:hypothetical protein
MLLNVDCKISMISFINCGVFIVVRNLMKPFLLSIISVVSCCHCFGQHDTTLSFVEDAIRRRKGVDKIVYLDKSLSFYQPFHSFIRRGNIEGYKGQTKVKMKFTAKEVQHIDKEFKKKKSVRWKDALFTNSVRINEDTLLLLSKDTSSRAYFRQSFGNKYFLVSQPILVRNGTVVIFRVAEMVEPSAGYDLLYIYARKQGKWEQQMLIHAGAW